MPSLIVGVVSGAIWGTVVAYGAETCRVRNRWVAGIAILATGVALGTALNAFFLGLISGIDALVYTVAETAGWGAGLVGIYFLSVEWDKEPEAQKHIVN